MSGSQISLVNDLEAVEAATDQLHHTVLFINGWSYPPQAAQSAFEITLQTRGRLTVIYLVPPHRYEGWFSTDGIEHIHFEPEVAWRLLRSRLMALAEPYQLSSAQLIFEQAEFQNKTGLHKMAQTYRADVVILACQQWPTEMWCVS